jgi:hypothetical protein
MGRLAHEYEEIAASAAPWWRRLRADDDDSELSPRPRAGWLRTTRTWLTRSCTTTSNTSVREPGRCSGG